MFRENLEENKGMLFVFPEEKSHNFWMRNTLIPLDIIHIDSNHKVVDIISAPPCEEENCPIYKSEQQSQRSLEINS
ncbi:DUF192 domain-containing protein [bacterium]|nr:DUF192 domain-containing protein [bacterium]